MHSIAKEATAAAAAKNPYRKDCRAMTITTRVVVVVVVVAAAALGLGQSRKQQQQWVFGRRKGCLINKKD